MGDLNLLKSWNPKLVKNRKKVWEIEQERLQEELKLKERENEIRKEKELNNLISNSNKNKKKTTGLEWMYDSNENTIEKEVNDNYLLGKKKLDATMLSKQQNSTRNKSSTTATKIKKKINYSMDDPMSKFNNMKKVIKKNKKTTNGKRLIKK